MPYKVVVAPLKGNMPALAALPGAADWEGTNGNAAHTGLVPVDLDASKFSRRWTWEYAGGEKAYRVSPPVAANGLVYFSLEQSAADSQDAKKIIYTNTLMALSEHDSGEQWRTPQTLDGALSAPGVSGTRLAMAGLASVHTFDAVSGVKLATATQPQTNGILTATSPLTAPTLAGASVYVGGNNDVISAESTTARNLWSTSLGLSRLGNVDEWTPAVNASTVYSNTAGTLRAFNRADGTQQWSVAVPGQVVGGLSRSSLYQAPVLADANSVLLLNQRLSIGYGLDNSLTLVDTDSRQVRWSANGQFTTQPVAAQGVLYVGNQATASLEARSLATGAVLWSWPLSAIKEERFGGDLIVTNKLLFVAGQKGTYALDLASQKSVWSFRLTGKLALSRNGVLYIRSVSDNGNAMSRVTAINLQ
ncbi:PQQ-binding-like beta-propeller repeat protein [Janthinobacterium lividum]|uniref:outer membrane protein assembly factor BamB family protein n=1 Tax=Janthinobacterium lividum TaxID=29581 RepID=UPI001409699F|nr:PQQ-binding-like beta-propeller repeat protein [Janthinobacterium lividum]NHQ88989.1 PQQ-binding-like beta-propeller repeat protein [Janthinobacterium lividum]